MASESQQTVTAEQLMALRAGPDALRAISEALQVKKMGPADHIRTKHEIKAFLGSSSLEEASGLIARVGIRLTPTQTVKATMSRRQSL